ncbi:MAG: T9SS type A sorting domain-containing protein [Bacteroidetes bacterium]|nr:MAG: T9SS type A sorting domain-containing protein [Bacteroidota bacterium]
MKSIIIKGLALALFATAGIQTSSAKEIIGGSSRKGGSDLLQRKAAGCLPATFQVDIDINNVRARILNGGDMWWDLNSVARYEIPKVTTEGSIRKNSMFAGAIWVGGVDVGGNLKVAAMTYRQGGSDYFPGPLDTTSGEIDQSRCRAYDKIWKVQRQDIEDYVDAGDASTAPDDILTYPGNGDQFYGEPKILAPFFDADGDGAYDPNNMDYPILDPTRPADRNLPKDQPDQMLFFVYNDKGNIHTETGGIPIGIELQTIAFAFATNDEVNNMTFYKTKITNRSFDEIRNCYFGQWVDADLGNYSDDYVGVDTARNLGFCYNGDDDDEGILGYGLNPPSVGTTFFEGPRDSAGNEIGLTKFVYYNNDFSVIGNPVTAEHYYGYLRGIWKDGSFITDQGNGYQQGNITSYMFPGDPTNPGSWHEKSAGNTPGDRRYLQSAGPFNLKPGAVNYVTVGVVWAKTTTGGATGSLNLLKLASDKAQKLFNNKFQIPDGPPAPTLSIQELDRELVITMIDSTRKLKDIENFFASTEGSNGMLNYRFQGYKIYQLRDALVSTGELDNIERARLAYQVDLRDEYARVINQELDPDLGVNIPKIKVDGANLGIQHSFKVEDDLFATGNTQLVNFKSYYYVVLAYATCVNDPNEPVQYLEGRLNVVTYRGIPHKTEPKLGGIQSVAGYEDGPRIQRIEGKGNGGVSLRLTNETISEILRAPYVAKTPIYLGGHGPVNIKVVDPLKVPVADFEFRMIDSTLTAGQGSDSLIDEETVWMLINTTDQDTVFSDRDIHVLNEQVIAKWGISVSVVQAVSPGFPLNELDDANGFIDAEIIWQDDARQWLTGLPDNDGNIVWLNWIRSGNRGRNNSFNAKDYTDDFDIGGESMDPFERYERILGGIIAPYALASRAIYSTPTNATYGIAYAGSQVGFDNRLSDLQSVEFVLTPDRTKWTRAVVLEMSEDPALALGNAPKHSPRRSPSLDIDLKPMTNGETGRSWFPGYAINLETGERMNIMFGEDSYLSGENGSDMIWNPTSNFTSGSNVSIGGKHYIYLMGRKNFAGYTGPVYDEGNEYLTKLNTGSSNEIRRVFAQAMWVMPPIIAQGYSMKDGVPPTEVKIRLQVKRQYGTYNGDAGATPQNNNMPYYRFNTADIAPQVSQEAGKNALDLIKVVPNPYYAYSQYEGSQLDNRVKITNLPNKCTINVFTVNGTLVRQIKKDDEATYVDWDLKNQVNVPIASGMYIVHIDAGDLGEKTVKWFGVMRQIDLDSF